MKLFSALFSFALAKEELTGAEFKAEVAKGPVFTKFYAPWCGHCKKLAPAWSELAEEINGDSEWGATIASVDCTQHKEACTENGVTGYPTLKYFDGDGGAGVKYTGARTKEALRDWLEAQLPDGGEGGDAPAAAPPAKGEVISLKSSNYKSLLAPAEQVSFVKFFAPWCGHCKKMAPAWVDLAKDVADDDSVLIAEVDCTVESGVCQENEVKGYPTLKAFKGGKLIEKYAGGRDLNSFKNALKKYKGGAAQKEPEKKAAPAAPKEDAPAAAASAVVDLTADNFASSIASGAWFIKFYAPWCGHCKKLAPTWEELAAAKTNAKIAKIDCTVHNAVCKENEVKGFPTLLFFQDGKNLGKHQGGRDLAGLKKSIDKFLNPGAAQEEEKADSAAVDDFFKKIAGKHAFVKFYAPWCGHCKKLAPTWTELEEKHAGNGAAAIFDVDCTADAFKAVCSKMGVRGYPTLQYFAPGAKEGEKYSGGRDMAALDKFITGKLGDAHDEL